MGLKYTEGHDVKYYECDFTRNMTLPMLISVLIHAVEMQENSVTDPSILSNKQLGWIITQYTLDIKRLPKQNEYVFVTTEAESYNKYFCYRDFWLHDQQGNELVVMKSSFALMNLQNRKIVPITSDVIDVYQAEKVAKTKRFPKVEQLQQNSNCKKYQVRYFDLDGNKHVNNAKYFDWIMDVLPRDFLENYEPQFVNIQFEKEVNYGEVINSFFELEYDNLLSRHIIKSKDHEGDCASAQISWRKKG